MVLISGCLIGVNCKYNGKHNLREEILTHFNGENLAPICPEQLGGLTTPRLPAEIQGGDGKDVLHGRAKVVRSDGVDVTEEFIKGANETLKIAKSLGITKAILKAKSPSCGAGKIYDGSFSDIIIDGDGVTTALLKENGIEVYSDEEFSEKI
ncbi:DUF523 domain-containing protein [Alkaliphilus oremlandii]|uniref:Uncharacterized protein n=1 Tax=Alkaliphilus oremlandii (strain OhILAs) TaxID=350688 RepID=A8MHU3_ALKOO|nr:DUF523 domain-containing protein [Alkaliphilus oremlandii]ABW19375.1 protein of unknown function DUF523 [Alkaliphilus oremlandii OhILAs]